jgi:hypothetical protein
LFTSIKENVASTCKNISITLIYIILDYASKGIVIYLAIKQFENSFYRYPVYHGKVD